MTERIVVVGGGIGGLAAAVALHRRNRQVVVLERAEEFTEIGAGLSLWPNAMNALATLGLADQVRATGAVETAGGVRDRAGRWLSRTDNAEIERRHGWPLVVVHRADLVRTLADALPRESLLPNSETYAVCQDGDGVVVEHKSGRLRADLVVAADGLNSKLRRQWWPSAPGPRYTGCTAWRAITAPVPGLRGEGSVMWGRGERIGFTVLPDERYYLFAAATTSAGVQDESELHRRFADWPDPIPALLHATAPEDVLQHDIYDMAPLPTYVCGRVVLLGDAAHPMNPILGQGACQALEDAVTLANCLDADVDAALARYDRLRRPRTQAIVRRSARLGAVAQWAWAPAALARDLGARLTPARATLRAMAPVLGWTADA